MIADMTNTQKVAALLLSLGTERSKEVLQHLNPGEASRIAEELHSLGQVPQQVRRAVLREFRTLADREAPDAPAAPIVPPPVEPFALPAPPPVSSAPLLETISLVRATELLAAEPPHIIALALVGVSPERALAILQGLPVDMRAAVTGEYGHVTPPLPEVRTMLEHALRAKAERQNQQAQHAGRVALAALTQASQSASSPATEAVNAFHTLDTLPHHRLSALLRQANPEDLLLALRGVDAAYRDRLLTAVPFNQRILLLHQLQRQGPVSLRAITAAQQRIAALSAREMTAPHPETVHA